MKKISIDGLTNVLSPKEMKQVTGGVAYHYCILYVDKDKTSEGPCGLADVQNCLDAMCEKYKEPWIPSFVEVECDGERQICY